MTGYTTVKTGVGLEAQLDAWRNSEGQIETDYTVWIGAPVDRRFKLDEFLPNERKALLQLAARKVEEEERKAGLP